MARVENEVFAARVQELVDRINDKLPNTVVSMMRPAIVSSDSETMSLTISYPAQDWELNAAGAVHGGITSTMFDSAMGLLAYAITGGLTSTISLNVSFPRPAAGDGTFMVRVYATMAGRTVMYMNGEMWDTRAPEKIVATASGVFRNLTT